MTPANKGPISCPPVALNPLGAGSVVLNEGYKRLNLHGLCAFGPTSRLLLKAVCGGETAQLRRLDAGFFGRTYFSKASAIETCAVPKAALVFA